MLFKDRNGSVEIGSEDSGFKWLNRKNKTFMIFYFFTVPRTRNINQNSTTENIPFIFY